MGKTYYHVAPSDKRDAILQNGLRPSRASECPSGEGVHVSDDIGEARRWVGRLREERDEYYYSDFVVFEVTVDDTYDVVEDEFVGHAPEGYVICTKETIPPSAIGVSEAVY